MGRIVQGRTRILNFNRALKCMLRIRLARGKKSG